MDFAPKAGYLLSDKFAVGVSLGIESGKLQLQEQTLAKLVVFTLVLLEDTTS